MVLDYSKTNVASRLELEGGKHTTFENASGEHTFTLSIDSETHGANQVKLGDLTIAIMGDFPDSPYMVIHNDHKEKILSAWREAAAVNSQFKVEVTSVSPATKKKIVEQTLAPVSGTRGTPAAYAPAAPGIPER
jgi:hypothetical protein